ncbi:MAG: hypothetical protein U0T82_17905 [Bacteroidales bacterium]
MSILKTNFDQTVRQKFGKSLDALEKAFNLFGIDYYLIGAFVREVWTDHIPNLPDKRMTRDLDFAIYIREHTQFEALKNHLVENEKFIEHDEPYRLLTPERNIIDLIPFGGIEENNEVLLKGHKVVQLSVFGTREVTSKALIIEGSFKVITLPGLVVMKLISGNENPGRGKDLEDFYYILLNYADIASDDLYLEQNLDLLETCSEVRFAGARLVAREMQPILNESQELRMMVLTILTKHLGGFSFDDIDGMYEEIKPPDRQILRLKSVRELLDELKMS